LPVLDWLKRAQRGQTAGATGRLSTGKPRRGFASGTRWKSGLLDLWVALAKAEGLASVSSTRVFGTAHPWHPMKESLEETGAFRLGRSQHQENWRATGIMGSRPLPVFN
jgi:hypothetical protein